MSMVVSGAASRVTLSGLKFGDELVATVSRRSATPRAFVLEPIPWPEDAGCDLIVRRVDE